jgi:hypothetical protein
LATLVRFGIGPVQEEAFVRLQKNTASPETPDSVETQEQPVLPWFDMPDPGTEHSDQPVSTEAEGNVEVM